LTETQLITDQNRYPILKTYQKGLFISCYVLTAIISLLILEIAKSTTQPVPIKGKIQDYSKEIILILIILQVLIVFPLLIENIFNILKNKISKIQSNLFFLPISGIFFCIVFIFYFLIKFSLDRVSTEELKLFYWGVSPEITIASIITSIILYYFPSYLLLRHYKFI